MIVPRALNTQWKKQYFLCFFYLFSSMVVCDAQYNVEFKELFVKADSLVVESNYEEAMVLYKEALQFSNQEYFFNDIAYIYKKLGFLEGKQKHYEIAQYNYLKSLNYDSTSLLAADCYHNMALVKRKLKQKDSVIYYLKKAIFLYDNNLDADDNAAGNVYMNAGRIYKDRQKYQTALNYLLKAYERFNDAGNLKGLASTSSAIAHIHNDLKNTDKAFQYYYESLNLRLKLNDTLNISRSYNNLANAFKEDKEIDSAMFYYRKSLALKSRNNISTAKNLYNIGICYYLQDKNDSANIYYKKSLEIYRNYNDSLEIGKTYNELVCVALLNDEILLSKQYLDSTDVYITAASYPRDIYRNHEMKALYFARIGNYKKAYEYQKKYDKLYTAVFNKGQVDLVKLLQERFESEQRKRENLQLTYSVNEQQVLIEKQESKLRFNRLFVFVLGLLVLLMLAGYFWIRQKQLIYKQKQKLEKMDAIFKGQEFIKKSIGKDLHDIITTNFDGLRLKILALPNAKDIKNTCHKIAEEIKSVNAQVRLISHRLSPLDDKIKRYSLTTIINSQLSEFQMYRKIFVNLETEIPDALNHIGIDAQTNFYGILLEALNNIERHSKATEISIKFHISKANFLHMNIKDNGIGFNNENKTGVGIFNIKQRAALLKGECDIKATDDGTLLTLSFPLKTN